ncbi:MAG: WhiB family transcriptional regulator [Ferrimicrobium sp.]
MSPAPNDHGDSQNPWFEPVGGTTWQSMLAKEICTACTGKESCLADALAHPTTHGIRGGLSFPKAKQAILKRRRLVASL